MDQLSGKTIVILGLARQGIALARFAVQAGANVIVSDLRSAKALQPTIDKLANIKITYILGEHPMKLLDEAHILAISGGVPTDAPIVAAAQTRGIPITNDSQEFVRRTPTDVIGITGSAGKTTTTALTGVMGQMGKRRTWVGGNIGRPLIADLHKMNSDDMVVQELSSFQLELWEHSPPIAAVLNITPNHLDRHKTMEAYIEAKANILRYQSSKDIAILCADDPGALSLKPLVKGRLRLFSREQIIDDGVFVKNGHIWLASSHKQTVSVCSLDDIQLRGPHNVLNVLAAVTLADSVGIPVPAIVQAIKTFKGVEHRLELVQILDEVQYINDSIATTPERALAALDSFYEPLILLAGGKDKDMDWTTWAERVPERVKHVVLFGALADMLESALSHRCPITHVESLAEAVQVATSLAEPGDVVLLSPGGTSYDAFTDFAQRGQVYRDLVTNLQRNGSNSPYDHTSANSPHKIHYVNN